MQTRAIHAIWTTYLTWPPGDDRGHWSSLFNFYGNLIERGHKLNIPDRNTRARAEQLAHEPEKVLTDPEIGIVAGEIATLLYHDPFLEGATIHAAAIERTHTHLLLSNLRHDISEVIGRIKSQTSSRLLKLPQNADRQRTWTNGYWKVFLFDDAGPPTVQRYIEAHNVRRGLKPAPYSWITPL